VADGCIAALRAGGLKPGEDVFLSGADGTTNGAQMIKQGRLLATSANVPAYMGALLTTRLYDVLHGWRPRASERLMSWRSITMTKTNVDAYLARYVNNGDVPPFDYKKMSKVELPTIGIRRQSSSLWMSISNGVAFPSRRGGPIRLSTLKRATAEKRWPSRRNTQRTTRSISLVHRL
jgi:hypothetical protein